MLVLSRQIGEEIVIAGEIHVKVAAIKGKQVRLGITAPPAVRVRRLELLEECRQDPAPRTVKRMRKKPRPTDTPS